MNRTEMDAEEKRWRTESDLRTLAEADRIRADKGCMADVKAMAKEQVQALQRVTGQQGAKASSGPKTEIVGGLRVNRTRKGE